MSVEIPIEDKQAIESAFGKSAVEDLVITDKSGEKSAFIFKSPAYYDLKVYLDTGLRLNPSYESFAVQYPKANLAELVALENGIYEKMQRTIVELYNNCNEFNSKSWGKFMILATSIIQFCDDFAKYVGGKGLLLDLLKKLEDESVTDETEIKKNQQRAIYICDILATRAKKKAEECTDLYIALTAFKNKTSIDKSRIDYLVSQFIKNGPYEPMDSSAIEFKLDGNKKPISRLDGTGKPMKPYSVQLQGTLAELRATAAKAAEDARKADKEWEDSTIIAATAVTYVWIVPFGTIAAGTVMGVYGDRAVKAKDEYNRKKAEESIANEKAKTLSGCCDIVTNLEANFKNLDEKITKALDALEQMETHFLKQQDGLKRLQNAIAMTANHTQEADAFMRSLANTEMPDAITAYLTVKTQANNFIASANPTYKFS